VTVPVILSDLERRDAKVKLLRRISVIAHQPFDVERPNSAVVTLVGEERVFKGQTRPQIRGTGSDRPPNFWELLHAHTQYEKQQPNFAWRL